LGSIQSKQLALGHADPFHEAVGPLVLPVSAQLAQGINAASDFTDGLLRARRLAADNRALLAQSRSAAMYVQRLDELQEDVDRARSLLGLKPVGGRVKVPAEIAGFFPNDNRVTITVGSNQGVQAGMPVVTGDGLFGVVQSVSRNMSQVTLISSPYIRVGAITSRNPPAAGLLHGESTNSLILEFLDFDTPIQNGDLVVTSGFSEHIPRGIPIGQIMASEDNREFGTRRARVFPSVHLGAVREVCVLK
jgi:rod shape-determining protein MreC